MPDVEQLFRDYVAEHREGGEADPRAFLAQVEGADRIGARGADRRIPRALARARVGRRRVRRLSR